ncbi:MAG TPA: hypothetical protein VFN18_11835 [Solirubrobacterales bacterium]|nr:hypothetical protein [Solirubrobacterales bacterium]
MSLAILTFWFIVALFAFWLLGGILARLGGLLLVLAGIADFALAPNGSALLLSAIGALIWLAGHWYFALRHHEYKSPLARYVFCRWAPSWADPTRNWAVAVAPERADCARGGRR